MVAEEAGNKRRITKYRKHARKKNQNVRMEIKCVRVKKEQRYLVKLKKSYPKLSNYYIEINVNFCTCVCPYFAQI